MLLTSEAPELIDFLQNLGTYIPLVLKYYLPGYFFYRIVSKAFTNPENSESKYIIEIVISWIIVFCTDSILKLEAFSCFNNIFFQIVLSLLFGFLAGHYVLRKFKTSNDIKVKALKFFGYARGSVLSNLAHHKNSRARVFMKSDNPKNQIIIYGEFAAVDIENEPKYISLRNYIINDKDKNKKDFIMIPMSEVQYLEFDMPINKIEEYT